MVSTQFSSEIQNYVQQQLPSSVPDPRAWRTRRGRLVPVGEVALAGAQRDPASGRKAQEPGEHRAPVQVRAEPGQHNEHKIRPGNDSVSRTH